jgi:hypothetical protein
MDSNTTTDSAYTPPTVRELGTLSEHTLSIINKSGTSGDVIVIGGQSIPVPGSSIDD